MIEIHAKKPNQSQSNLYCVYCRVRKPLMYLYHQDTLLGLGLDKMLYCSSCKRTFKIGTHGFFEFELSDCKIIEVRQ